MIYAALESVLAELRTVVSVVDAGIHPGVVDPTELGRLSTRTPALYLACPTLVPDPEPLADWDGYDYQAGPVAYVLMRDAPGAPRLPRMYDELIVPLLGYIDGQIWGGLPWLTPAGQPRARSLYSLEIDRMALALWTVEWEQSIRIPRYSPET